MTTRVLSIASECVPLVKTGGLADVAGALPAALAPEGIEVATLLPGYPAVMAALKGAKAVKSWEVLFGGPARILAGKLGQTRLFALDAPHLLDLRESLVVLAGVLGIGFVNFLVSFGLTLAVTLKSRRVTAVQFGRLFRMLVGRFLRNPLAWLIPPRRAPSSEGT